MGTTYPGGDPGRHPREDVEAAAHPALSQRACGRVRFFIVGDVGQPGKRRQACAQGMAQLQQQWAARGEPACTFAVGTGDQVYGDVDAAAFNLLETEVLNQLPIPWVMALGNHDVDKGGAGWRWHNERHGTQGGAGWRWICPAPTYSLDAVAPGLGGPVDLVVINTNKHWGVKSLNPPGPGQYLDAEGRPAVPFYTSSGSRWWREQKRSLEDYLTKGGARPDEGGRFRIVVGHHPCEYVEDKFLEHKLPGAKYYLATFMRGGRRGRKVRWGLAHIIRRGADMYVCGHQHLMAHMQMRYSRRRGRDELRCQYSIVGSSSKTEQDDDDFADVQDAREPAGDDTDDRDEASPAGAASPRIPEPPSGRYEVSWVSRRVGFAVVDASSSGTAGTGSLRITYYSVDMAGVPSVEREMTVAEPRPVPAGPTRPPAACPLQTNLPQWGDQPRAAAGT
eukprot:TRINITY_DN12901_c0_g2_i2.p1 TRINITY_DN12901_c0_g2~~TRINITY_DN12901_c0_g2_i2.p1  ORF type:complete len:468 (+),score=91.01 TRINITY_DN12901_c0_g2_i2:60-1406(+)